MLLSTIIKANQQDAPGMNKITYRPAYVAGSFYPADNTELKKMLKGFIEQSDSKIISEPILGLIVPHAGYVYSGWVAGKAYSQLKGKKYDAIIIIAPSHHANFSGSSVFNGDAYVTPLGNAIIDKELAKEISSYFPDVILSDEGHNKSDSLAEHSIEVQIPFLQQVQPFVPIVPICMGSQDFQSVNRLAKSIVSAVNKFGKNVLLVASSDLSHFHKLKEANYLDSQIVKDFENYNYFKLSYELFSRKVEACGAAPIIAVMMASEMLGGNLPITMQYSTSADSPYEKSSPDRVVGYFSGLIVRSNSEQLADLPDISPQTKHNILELAKNAVISEISGKEIENHSKDNLLDNIYNFPVFVTLQKRGNLRACMGHIFTGSSLSEEIDNSARTASKNDYRFGPIKKDELNSLEYEVTILSRFKRIKNNNDIKIGTDGLFLRLGNSNGLLLPQVASDRNWNRTSFLENLCLKAGLDTNAYKNPDAEIYKFSAIIIHE